MTDNRYRSGLERQVAAQLDRLDLPFEYETQRVEYVRPAKPSRYTPDFVITTGSGKVIYIETKGRFDIDDRAKHRLIREQHPELDIRFVFSNSKNKISKTSKTTYADWCERYEFLFADKRIPQEWINE